MYFAVDDNPCLDPKILLQKFRELRLDYSQWINKANSLEIKRGVDPSVGYFLLEADDIVDTAPSGPDGTHGFYQVGDEVVVDVRHGHLADPTDTADPTTTQWTSFHKKKYIIQEATCVYGYPDANKGIYLIKVVDNRIWWHSDNLIEQETEYDSNPLDNYNQGWPRFNIAVGS